MTQLLSCLPWHQAVASDLSSRIDQGRLPHALLLAGPAGIGKTQLAVFIAQRLLCSTAAGKSACGHCKSCELLSVGNHPDLQMLEPAEGKAVIAIDQVRALAEFLAKTAQQGGWKVAVLRPADAMNINSANALLKNLEEPAGNSLLILVSDRPARLPATIRSRCQRISLTRPTHEEAARWLTRNVDEYSSDQLSRALSDSDGAPLLALHMLKSGNLEQRDQFESLLASIHQGQTPPLEAAQQCKALDIDRALDWFIGAVHRMLSVSPGQPGTRPLFRFLDELNQAREWIASPANVNQQLLWEELLLDWKLACRSL